MCGIHVYFIPLEPDGLTRSFTLTKNWLLFSYLLANDQQWFLCYGRISCPSSISKLGFGLRFVHNMACFYKCWVLMCSCPTASTKYCWLIVFHYSDSYILSTLSSSVILELWEKGLLSVSHLGLNFPQSFTFCAFASCWSLC